VYQTIIDTTNQEIEKKYKILDEKISGLVSAQKPKVESKRQFYPRVINKTKISFSVDEMNMLNKGLKCNLGSKQKTGSTT
jgi:hypothetical protein